MDMQNIRNIAIIAHVDHGKTTLVDKIIHATNIFRENQESGELIMDNNDLERKRDHDSYPKIFLLLIKTQKLT
jgi:GTP-binding protein